MTYLFFLQNYFKWQIYLSIDMFYFLPLDAFRVKHLSVKWFLRKKVLKLIQFLTAYLKSTFDYLKLLNSYITHIKILT